MTHKTTPIFTTCALMCIAVLCNVQFFSDGGKHSVSHSEFFWVAHSSEFLDLENTSTDIAILPSRMLGAEFQHNLQLTPVFELVFAFFVNDTVIAHLTYLRTIPNVEPWYQRTSGVSVKSRLSGWKQSRDPHANSFSIVKLV